MIKLISIDNFQSHRLTRLELEPGVNVIVGPSDSGKSAVLRALNWTVFNRPLGDAFRSGWGGDTEVVITTDDGEVKRRKTDTQAEYIAAGKLLKATGTEPPREVSDILRLGDLNIQTQHDSPFMLGKDFSPGERARLLNRVVSLDVIDRALAKINALVKEYTQREKQLREEFKSARAEAESLVWVEAAQIEARQIGELEAAAIRIRRECARLSELIAGLDKIEDELAALPPLKGVDKGLAEIEQIAGRAEVLSKDAFRMSELLGRLRSVEQQFTDAQDDVVELSEELERLMPDICPLCGRGGK